MTVGELVSRLRTMSQDAKIEFEVPHRKPADRGPLDGARVEISSAEEVFYNEVSNKYVVLT